jgi:signal transduction histidine kinase
MSADQALPNRLDAQANNVAEIRRVRSDDRNEQIARHDERVRLARKLHDGVLQSLTGAVLHLDALARLIAEDPAAASRRARDLAELIACDQRELRCWIDTLRGSETSAGAGVPIAEELDNLCRRAERQWGVPVELHTGTLPVGIDDETRSLIGEALSNAGQHSGSAAVHLRVGVSNDRLEIVVADDGRGFPFRGRYDLQALIDGCIGPQSVTKAVVALGGTLVLTSDAGGSRLDISLPLSFSPHRDNALSD